MSDHLKPLVVDENLLGILRRLLWRLPELDRRLVALQYGGGMDVAEIAAELELPEKIVAFRIKEAMDNLCVSLQESGVQLAENRVSGRWVKQAITDGTTLEPDRMQRVYERAIEAIACEVLLEQVMEVKPLQKPTPKIKPVKARRETSGSQRLTPV